MGGYGRLAAEVYDVAYPVGHSMGGDVEFYRELLGGVNGPVLEPAVGTGRVLVPLLEAGLRVDGYDLSPDMVTMCRAHCTTRKLAADVEVADMTTHRPATVYAAVVVPTGSVALLDDAHATAAALEGFFGVDVVGDYAGPPTPANTTWTFTARRPA